MGSTYRNCYEGKLYNNIIDKLLTESQQLSSFDWEDTYWLAKCIYEANTTKKTDEVVISILTTSFSKGLNLRSDNEKFLDAAQILSRLYIKNTDYIRAINYLMDLDDFLEKVPDWVNIYYLMAQIMTDNIFRHAEDPVFLFARLDRISPESYVQRAKVYQIYLKRLHDIEEIGTDRTLNIDKFEALEEKYIGDFLKMPEYVIDLDEEDDDDYYEEDIEESEENIGDEDGSGSEEPEASTEQSSDDARAQIAALQEQLEQIQKAKDEEIQKLKQKVKDREDALVRIRTSNQEQEEDSQEEDTSDKQLLKKNEQILVLGATAVEIKHLIGVAKGFGLTRDNLEFVDDYDKMKHFTSRITPGSSRYRAIICGPMPHKVEDTAGYSSLVVKLQTETDLYPYTVKCAPMGKDPKITKTSFRNAMMDVARALSILS